MAFASPAPLAFISFHFPKGVLVLGLVSILFASKCSTLDTTDRLQTPLLRSRGEWGLLDGPRPGTRP
jgi:hypothetical protein